MRRRISNLSGAGAAALVCALGAGAGAFARQSQPQQTPQAPQAQATPAEAVRAVSPPRNPLPPEEKSAGVTRFSFIVYGDTRGRRDGVEVQYEHSLVVDSMLAAIKRLEKTDSPVRFVLQSGDAVVDGREPRQWNASFVDLINRLTVEGGVPYFLAPGNHDVTGASALDSPERQKGLRNYLSAVAQLIPPDGAARRLKGYPTYAFGYGNTFLVALDSNIADDDAQFEWCAGSSKGSTAAATGTWSPSSTTRPSPRARTAARASNARRSCCARATCRSSARTASAPFSPGTSTSSSTGSSATWTPRGAGSASTWSSRAGAARRSTRTSASRSWPTT